MSNSLLLSLGQTLAGVPQAVANGREAGRQQYDAQEARVARRAEVQHKKKIRELELAKQGSVHQVSNATDERYAALSERLEFASQQNSQLGRKAFRSSSYQALDSYLDDGDVKHLNNFIQEAKDNPYAPKAFQQTSRVDNLDFKSDSDRQLLLTSGVSREELDALDGSVDGELDWTVIAKRYKRITNLDGTTRISDVVQFATMSGYARHATAQRLADMQAMADVRKASRVPRAPAAKKDKPPSPTAMYRDSNLYAKLKSKVDAGVATEEERNRFQFIQQEQGGTEVAKDDIANTADAQVKPYLDLPFKEFRNNTEVRKLVRAMELNHPMAAHDRKMLTDLSQLTSLLKGDKSATNLSKTQTGIWDKFSGSVWKKVEDSLDPGAVASYGAFMNQLRHNLFGSALTEHEISAFNEAYSNRKDKLGPVLSGLRAATAQLVGKYEAIENQNNEAVMKFYSGEIGSSLRAAQEKVNWKLGLLQRVADGEISQKEALSMRFNSPEPKSKKLESKPQAPAQVKRKPNQSIADYLAENN